MNEITRRAFLRNSLLGLGGLALSGTLAACGGAAIAPAAGKVAAGVVGSAAVAAGQATVSRYLKEFAVAVGSAVVAAQIDDWLNGLPADTFGRIAGPMKMMVDNGFTYFDTPVFNFGGTQYFGALNQNGYDACALFLAANGTPMLEGPGLMGICCSGLYWAEKGYNVGRLVVPLHAHQTEGSRFDLPFSKHVYDTPDGTVELDYDTAGRGEGEVRVLAHAHNGDRVLDEKYRIQYA